MEYFYHLLNQSSNLPTYLPYAIFDIVLEVHRDSIMELVVDRVAPPYDMLRFLSRSFFSFFFLLFHPVDRGTIDTSEMRSFFHAVLIDAIMHGGSLKNRALQMHWLYNGRFFVILIHNFGKFLCSHLYIKFRDQQQN